jgi:hypothetical protein
MDETIVEALARAAGLDTVWHDFRADLLAAASQVEDQRRVLNDAPAPAAEPWPAMSVPERDD